MQENGRCANSHAAEHLHVTKHPPENNAGEPFANRFFRFLCALPDRKGLRAFRLLHTTKNKV